MLLRLYVIVDHLGSCTLGFTIITTFVLHFRSVLFLIHILIVIALAAQHGRLLERHALVDLVFLDHLFVHHLAAFFVDTRMQLHQLHVNVEHENALTDLVFQGDFTILQLMIIINILPNLLVNDHSQEVGEPLDTDELGALWIELAFGPELVELADGAQADLQALFIH